MSITKKPYEISLWDEQLVWHRRELEPVIVNEEDYRPGVFFSQNPQVDGAIPYALDFGSYRDDQRYYRVKKDGKFLENNSDISNNEDWKADGSVYTVTRLKKFETGEIYFLFSNKTGEFSEVEVKEKDKPDPAKIYFKQISGASIPNELVTFYEEIRLCTIGSDTMDSPARAVNGKLVRKVNGEVTFTFTVYYRYFDNQTGQLEYNPFVPYLTNERKVKLKYDGEWYDLIIKQVQENSDSKAFTYTCKSQFVNELSKTGFELEFDNELENNMGTVEYLAEQILEGSDWRLEGKSDLKQFIEEPLYKVEVKDNPSYYDSVEILNPTKDFSLPPAKDEIRKKTIYVFYSDIVNKREDIQFLYVPGDTPFEINDDLVINKDKYPNYVLKNVTYGNATASNIDANGMEWPDFVRLYESAKPIISPDYRGMRLVKQARTIYDAKIDKYVQEYTKEGDPTGKVYYGFEETKYLSPNAVNNYVVNPNAFTSISGWYVQPNAEGAKATLELVSDPPFEPYYIKFEPADTKDLAFCYELQGDEYVKTKDTTIQEKDYYRLSLEHNFTSYLKFPNNGGALVNSSINSHKSSLEGFEAGKDRYVLRLKYKTSPSGELSTVAPNLIRICRYKDMENFEITDKGEIESPGEDVIFQFSQITGNSLNKLIINKKEEGVYLNIAEDGYLCFEATCLHSLSAADLKNWDKYYGLFLNFNESNIYIEDIQLFPYVLDDNGKLCVPGGELFAKIETTKKYYDPSKLYSSLEEIEFEPTQPEDTYLLKYAEGAEAYTKVSSITAKESNRFNLLQDLNEKFECWVRFRVEHDQETGKILYGKDKKWYNKEGEEIECPIEEVYRQQKFVSFHEYAGKPNYVGFKYGINSKSIQRTLDSNAIVSKMIVKDNANEFARNGFCSIARATDNSSKENFVLNFDHYYRHKLLDLDVVTNDLYVDGNGYLGYYKKLKEINQDREILIDEQANLLKEIANYEAQYQTYKTSHDSAIEERNQMEDNIFLLIVPKEKRDEASRLDFPEIIATYSVGWEEDSSYRKYTTSWMQCDNVIKQHSILYQNAYNCLNGTRDENDEVITQGVKAQYEEITARLKEKTEQKRALNLQFYKKYSRFIQEGSWIKEDYVDDNLYYLDSLSTLHTSAQPKVTYNISVIDVSPLSGYKDYEFELGDITYIEDREFFGYSLIDRAAPYREEIVVNEITTELDAPEKNSIKVQNYKTQFEDLFQRITAQTQQAEYHTGEYQRAASVVEPGGNISASTLENSFANNSFKLSNARDQSVVIDSSGITSTSLANPSEMVRIVNGGIFMSTDGGRSWKTGLTGYGLNSSYLTAGQINTDEIYIMNGNNAAFRWDEKGLSSYYRQGDYYDPYKFVRFDHNGIYGILANDEWTGSDEEIHDSASFALTWSGFSLKNSDGSVRISTDNDIQVLQKQEQELVERIKIGRLDNTDNPNYGIRIKDAGGNTIMETDLGGQLWLRDKLSIGTDDTSTVEIGYLKDRPVRDKTTIHEVIHAGDSDSFIVYEDGHVIANYIEVNGGKIGNMTVDALATVGYEVVIVSSKGTSLKEGSGTTLTATLYLEGSRYDGSVTYQWYDNEGDIVGETSQNFEIKNIDFDATDYIQYGCRVTVSQKEESNGN